MYADRAIFARALADSIHAGRGQTLRAALLRLRDVEKLDGAQRAVHLTERQVRRDREARGAQGAVGNHTRHDLNLAVATERTSARHPRSAAQLAGMFDRGRAFREQRIHAERSCGHRSAGREESGITSAARYGPLGVPHIKACNVKLEPRLPSSVDTPSIANCAPPIYRLHPLTMRSDRWIRYWTKAADGGAAQLVSR